MKLLGQMNRNLIGSIYGRSTKKIAKEELLDVDQPETRIAYGDHVCQQIGTK
jgi:hypothetical protein